ncbi:DegT/DnrJ/EryC1/StrS family aminotransferase [Roseospirillum parvum]|uniref:dTDP-4-amino-4,6-dideoxygalactose transaminase n=1 Tax=Roseospirillum parvum TaxID=83401 RepID=A0A1G7ZIN3_9PROT|nr:DegT/DnrJ/EryC1/StrS family aminotransferase [Roseospirillum parvum]SDH07950.1 dTDP-4-amino-4,6-dideoxygalactose transaminase [Roseospirillum parvum]
MSLPFIDLAAQQARLKPELDRAIAEVLAHGRYIMGPEVEAFEEELAAFAGAGQAVSLASGTDALMVVLMAWNIGPGDAVFVPSFTFTATAEAVLLLGARPVFVEVDDSFNLDPADLEAKIAQTRAAGRLTPRAIIAVDLFGLPADYPRINAIARAEGLKVLADAAQSFGGSLDGKKVGTLADATATSFFPAKPLGCYGDGGAVLTDDAELAQALASIRQHGKGGAKYDIVRVGVNSRLDTLQAAILRVKLAAFPGELEVREAAARAYDTGLANAPNVTPPPRRPGATSAWAQYTIRLPERDATAARLKEAGIPSAVYYPLPMHLQSAYRDHGDGPGSLPLSEHLSGEVLSLPMHGDLETETASWIASQIAG